MKEEKDDPNNKPETTSSQVDIDSLTQKFQKFYKYFVDYYNNGEKMFENDKQNCQNLQIHSYQRNLLWFFLLDILPYNSPSNWEKILNEKREEYKKIKEEYITENINEFIYKKKEKDKFADYFKFKEILSDEDYKLLDLIKIDVNRTFKFETIFKEDSIEVNLINILFTCAKYKKDISYKQGMSELCAMFLYVLYRDEKLSNNETNDDKDKLFYLIHSNNEQLESDTFILYLKFMEFGFYKFYKYTDEEYKDGELSEYSTKQLKSITEKKILNSNESLLKKRIYLLYYTKFPKIDKELYEFMSEKLEPEIFMLKWYLCAFAREFPLHMVVHIWDLILLYNYNQKGNNNNDLDIFKFIDCISLSMIIHIKTQIMKKKNSSQLMAFLMKYPKDVNLIQICKLSINIFNQLYKK